MVSYQHGTVYGKQEVPSFPDQSPETQLMIAQFAGQGYVLIRADYFGMGLSEGPEGYMVKASHQQATYDMLSASRAVLDHMEITTEKLFIAGWSQGGFVTMAFLEKLESAGVAVHGAATASAPVDIQVALSAGPAARRRSLQIALRNPEGIFVYETNLYAQILEAKLHADGSAVVGGVLGQRHLSLYG